jgi:phosphoglycolate phosphatase
MDTPQSFLRYPHVIIFDCDGVLFDSRRANQSFYNHLLEQYGRPLLTESDLTYVHMHTAGESIAYLFADEPLREAVVAYSKTLDYTPFIQLMDPEPGLIDFLSRIRPKIKTAISTNRTTTIDLVLENFSLGPYFDLVVSALDVERPKPDPESIYKILSHFGIEPESALFIGDSEIDARAARSAGVPLVAYKNEEMTADLHIQGFAELAGFLEDLSR